MKILLVEILLLLALSLGLSEFNRASAQSDIVAIDVLLEPDQTMLDSARVYNELMRRNYAGPGSYALDVVHTPHITVLQCFVKTGDLRKVYAAIRTVVRKEEPTKEQLITSGFYYYPYKNLGLAGITIVPSTAMISFQSEVINALRPFIVVGADAAFVQNADKTPIAAGSSEYVNGFIQDHSGVKYNPHVTIGLAHEEFLKTLMAKPYNKFTFKARSVSIYQLGDFGTARTRLWSSSNQVN